jgi:hypothetical protein
MRNQNVFIENHKYGVTLIDLTSTNEGELVCRSLVRSGIHYTYIAEVDGRKFSSPADNILIIFVVDGTRAFLPLLASARKRFRKKTVAVVEWSEGLPLEDICRALNILRIRGSTSEEVSQTVIDIFEAQLEERYLQDSNRQLLKASRSINLAELADRIDLAANAIADLRLNSTADITGELKDISSSLRNGFDQEQISSKESAGEYLKGFLIAVAKLYDYIENSRMASVVVCGAVTAILGCTGWSATFSMGLTLAAWQGKDAFLATVSKLPGPKKLP